MVPQWLIERKRDGGELAPDDIRAFVQGFTTGRIPDYQMAALAMAIFFRGLSPAETAALTDALLRSGDRLDLSSLPRPTADKHSTGGIGDKISLILAPLAASYGLAVPMISGRGLGLTGGTLDKLDAIPGFNTRLDNDAFLRIVARVGCAIIGQTDRLAPADRALYALRDVTGTVPSIPLITASILSKKVAEGAQSLIFDVKCGRGAFMRTPADAQALADNLVRVGCDLGRRTAALITDMDRPLGRTIGNALEVREAIDVLRGGGPGDVRELTLELTVRLALLAGVSPDAATARRELAARLDDGRAAALFRDMVAAQGGHARILDDPALLPHAAAIVAVPSPADGFVADLDAERLGRVALLLGAGRRRTDDAIDPAAGVDALLQVGTPCARGAPLMFLHARDDATARALLADAAAAVTLAAAPPPPHPLLLGAASLAASPGVHR